MPVFLGKCFFVTLILIAPVAFTSSAQELTEAEALQRFSEESPRAQEVRSQVPIVRAETRANTLFPNPIAEFTREDANQQVDDFFTIQQTLPVSGRLGLLRRASDAAVEVARNESEHLLLQLGAELRTAFYTLLAAQERREVLQDSISELQEVVRILRERERAGEGSAFDRLRAERELADAAILQVQADTQVAVAQAGLSAFFAPDAGPDRFVAIGQLESRMLLPSVEELISQALAHREDYRAEQQRLERFHLEQQAAGRLRIPEPSVYAGTKTFRASGFSDTGFTIGVNVPLPLFDRGQVEVARLQATARKTEFFLQRLRVQIEAEVKAARAAVEHRRRMAEQYRGELGHTTRELTRIAQYAYQEGELGILELLDAYRVGLLSELRSVDLLQAAKQAEIELDRVVGEEVIP